MGRFSETISVHEVATGQEHDCGKDGSINLDVKSRKFTVRQGPIQPGTVLKFPCPCINTDDLCSSDDRTTLLSDRDDILAGKHRWIKLNVRQEFWEHPLFDRLPLEAGVHAIKIRALQFSTGFRLTHTTKKDSSFLCPDIGNIKFSCDPNCQFNDVQELATNGVMQLTVLKQMNVGDEITLDHYESWVVEKRVSKMAVFNDTCTTEACSKCSGGRKKQK